MGYMFRCNPAFELTFRAARNAVAGLGVGLLAAIIIGFLIPVNMQSTELISRTIVGIDTIALALAAGAAQRPPSPPAYQVRLWG